MRIGMRRDRNGPRVVPLYRPAISLRRNCSIRDRCLKKIGKKFQYFILSLRVDHYFIEIVAFVAPGGKRIPNQLLDRRRCVKWNLVKQLCTTLSWTPSSLARSKSAICGGPGRSLSNKAELDVSHERNWSDEWHAFLRWLRSARWSCLRNRAYSKL